jgi:hypothetical protein
MPLENAYSVLYDSTDTETGTTANPFTIDGAGVAGTPAGGVVSVQGVAGGTALPVSGTVTANQGTAAAVASAWPILVTDGTDTAIVINTTPGAGDFGLVVRVAGTIATTIAQPATSTVTSVALSTTVATVLASNANRYGAVLWNNGSAQAYVKLGSGATTASFTVRMANQSEWEIPFPVYTGIITAITSAGTATMLATELTP